MTCLNKLFESINSFATNTEQCYNFLSTKQSCKFVAENNYKTNIGTNYTENHGWIPMAADISFVTLLVQVVQLDSKFLYKITI